MQVSHQHDTNVKAIVLSSAFPKFFSAGLDLQEVNLEKEGSDPARKAVHLRQHVLEWQQAISNIEVRSEHSVVSLLTCSLQECDKPVIVATAGIAYGLAVDICCAADIRYSCSDTTFSIKVA